MSAITTMRNLISTLLFRRILLSLFAAGGTAVQADGHWVHIPKQVKAYEMPVSSFLTEESKVALKQLEEVYRNEQGLLLKPCGDFNAIKVEDMPAHRRCAAEAFYTSQWYKAVTGLYPTVMKPQEIGGVYTEVFTPSSGIAPKNQNRVLINVHGGSFKYGSRTASHFASMPISAVGKIKVISIDYRMAPEYRYPAASEDVLAVYRELLKIYKPENIGLYGASAGGMLTAQSVALFQKEGLPLPAAVGMFSGAASRADGDSRHFVAGVRGYDSLALRPHEGSYFEGVDMSDPLITPAESDDILSKFPPSLLISSTRDFLMSMTVDTHRRLVRLGVEADLQIWEGLDHAQIMSPTLPHTREVYDVVVRFFDQHLKE